MALGGLTPNELEERIDDFDEITEINMGPVLDAEDREKAREWAENHPEQ